jgi:uncharacterized protein YhaN
VIVGPNEAGKSGLVALLRAALYGFRPAARDRYPWVPRGEDRAELEVELELDSAPLTVRRRLLSQPQGSVQRPDGSDQLRNAPLPEVTHVTDEVFGAVYALDLDSLTPPAGPAWTAIEERLLAGEVDPGIRPAALVLADLDQELADLGEARGRRRWGAIGRATEARDALRSALTEARRHEDRLHRLAADLAGVDASLAAIEERIKTGRAQRPARQARLNDLVALETEAAAAGRELAAAEVDQEAAAARFAELAIGLLAPGTGPEVLPQAGTLRALATRLRNAERDLEVARRLAAAPLSGGPAYAIAVVIAALGLAGLLFLPGVTGQIVAGLALAALAAIAWAGRGSPHPATLEAAARALREVQSEIATVLSGAGLAAQLPLGPTGELLERLAATAHEGQRLSAAGARADHLRLALTALAGRAGASPPGPVEGVPVRLAELRSRAEQAIRADDVELERAQEERDRLLDQRRELSAEQGALLATSPIDRLTGELHTADETLSGLHRQRDRLAALRELVREAQRRHRERFEPAVLKRAGELLSRLTIGRYDRLNTGGEPALDAPGEFGLEGPGGPIPLERASRGTRDQLLLALRLAVADEFDSGGARLPLILDEPLVNWDAQRREAGLRLLAEMALDRQIILLTCHDWLAREAVAAGARAAELPPPQATGVPSG